MLQLTFAVTLEYFLHGSFHKCFINLEGFKLMKSFCQWEGFHLLCWGGNWGTGAGMCRGGMGSVSPKWIRVVQTLHGISPGMRQCCALYLLGFEGFAFCVVLEMMVEAKDAPSVLLGQLLVPVLCPHFLPISLFLFFSSLFFLFPFFSFSFSPLLHSFFFISFTFFLFIIFSFSPILFFSLLVLSSFILFFFLFPFFLFPFFFFLHFHFSFIFIFPFPSPSSFLFSLFSLFSLILFLLYFPFLPPPFFFLCSHLPLPLQRIFLMWIQIPTPSFPKLLLLQ